MLFNSFSFLIFFPVITLLYFVLPYNMRWLMLLAASCFFYMFFVPYYIIILLVTIVVDYFAGILIEKQTDQKKKKRWLVLSIIANVGVLFVFKYFNFFIDNINTVAAFFHWNYSLDLLKIVLPIGLSFHTFQAMSYTIEVSRGNQKAERHFGIYALYVMYYPQLVAGPIERPQNLLWQFHKKHSFNYDDVTGGLKQMAWGLLKKVVIADRLAEFVNPVYTDPHSFPGISIFIATVFFTFQIYCDFSGYSDIAIGASRVMGIHLMKNFNKPYFSSSIAEFWKRWHVSLSTWFRDYLYIPLGGNRKGKWRGYLNIFIVFLVSGFWHGANWTFVVWGSLHGIYLLFGSITHAVREKIRLAIFGNKMKNLGKIIQVAVVFFLVCFAWIFFRAENMDKALYIAKNFFTGIPEYISGIGKKGFLWAEPIVMNRYLKAVWFEYFLIAVFIFAMLVVEFLQKKQGGYLWIKAKHPAVRWTMYFAGVYSILFFGIYHKNNEFIYFQF
ncbi:MAG: MBOAT family protein [Bacteroidia bacterium]|nr:MBOAT family protein [Bacteroidia bacterium]